ncbi:sugar (pentulose or hexulose) kinase [Roseinatronobacter thiooxidans]|uniref:Sugar (Pentulose or hexulose) kinase n=1 Tax=Roseinatronobacter thiooxidans TaxID=121821 RepID=A0A2W7QJ59_9RHOB|nr:FGGY-family carbohydrate kinase [Roseinatronobacter thiooxidans]PZX41229.1 sugar (pentulose or hexulose) kinase [Roseinatronobacter thiooxidans]
MTALALGIDLGTSGVRSAVLDPTGRPLASARSAYGPRDSDRCTPEAWWAAVTNCLSAQMRSLSQIGHSPAEITRIGVDGTSGSLVLTDRALVPVTRALMYDDAGFTREATLIARHAPQSHVANGAGSALARALRLVAEDPSARAAHLLHQADFIAARLMGKGGMTDYNNALKTGLDPAAAAWPDWMANLPLPAHLLPHALPPGAPFGPVCATVATMFGLSRATMVHAGTTDSIAAFLAASDLTQGAAVTSLGTTLAVKLFSATRIDAPEMGLYAHRLGAGWLLGGASNTGGGVLRHFFDGPQLTALSEKIDPAQTSPLEYYPLLKTGERFPVNDPTLAPRLEPRPTDDAAFLHGLLESIARIEKQSYDVMAALGAGFPHYVTTAGGGAENDTWTKIRARVLGVPVYKTPTPEAAVGTARLVQSGISA